MDKVLINALNGALEKNLNSITTLEGMAVETFKAKVRELHSTEKHNLVDFVVLSLVGDIKDTVTLRKLVQDTVDTCAT